MKRETIKKFIDYLADYSNNLINHHDFSVADFDSFFTEYGKFRERLKGVELPESFADALNAVHKIIIDKGDSEQGSAAATNFIGRIFGINTSFATNHEAKLKTIREARDRLSNLAFNFEILYPQSS